VLPSLRSTGIPAFLDFFPATPPPHDARCTAASNWLAGEGEEEAMRPGDLPLCLRGAACAGHLADARECATPKGRSWARAALLVCLLYTAVLGAGGNAPQDPAVSLAGPLLFRLQWLPPSTGPPTGGYRIIVIDNANRLIAHNKDVYCPCNGGETFFSLDNDAAETFSSEAAYPGAADVPELTIASGKTYSIFVAAFDASSTASEAGRHFRVP